MITPPILSTTNVLPIVAKKNWYIGPTISLRCCTITIESDAAILDVVINTA